VTNPSVLNSIFQYQAYDLYGIGGPTTYYMAGSTWATTNASPAYVLTINGNPFGGAPVVGIAPDGRHLLPGSPLIDAGFALPLAPVPFFPGYVDLFGRAIWGSTDFEGDARFAAGVIGGPVQIDVGADEVDAVAACRVGTVNDAAGPITDVLFVNGTNGGLQRETVEDSTQWLNVFMTPPPAPLNNKYYAAVWNGVPTALTVDPMPASLGLACFQLVTTDPQYTPPIAAAVANTVKPASPKLDPPGAYATGNPLPGVVLQIPPGTFAPGTALTVQGLIIDGATTSPKGGSMTNAVVVWMN
jgi:hypothetical protein